MREPPLVNGARAWPPLYADMRAYVSAFRCHNLNEIIFPPAERSTLTVMSHASLKNYRILVNDRRYNSSFPRIEVLGYEIEWNSIKHCSFTLLFISLHYILKYISAHTYFTITGYLFYYRL